MQAENLRVSIDGIYKIFTANVDIKFRRKVRAIFQKLSLKTEDFDIYAEIFKNTLNEFGVDEEDKIFIMSHFKSIRCLVCRLI